MLAFGFVFGFAFADPVMMAMKREETLDYGAIEEAGGSLPTLATLTASAALWQTIVASVVFAALLWCLRRADLGRLRYLLMTMLFAGTAFTVAMWAIWPKTPMRLAAITLLRMAAMVAATLTVWRWS